MSDEDQAVTIEHVVKRDLTIAEAARIVHPVLKRSTVIVRTFCQENR